MSKLNIKLTGFLITMFLSFFFTGFSQQQSNAISQVSIASPNAASLGKFVDIPVNYHSGIPSINIPVYTAKSGSLELPISLSYHASGLKVQEQASWVGAGWALNAGGVITRTVRGAPDEKQSNSLQEYYGYFSDFGYLSYMFKNDNGTARATNMVTGQEFSEGRYDGEPDLFFFNFNGYSGKFYFNDDRTPVLMPEQDIKIEYDYTPGLWTSGPGAYNNLGRNIEGFIITTPNGCKYYFGMTGSSPVLPNVQPIEVTSPYTLNIGPTYSRSISSWYLNKIVSADGGSSITLNYTRDSYGYYVVNMSNPASPTFSGTYSTHDLVKNLVDGVKLNQIIFSNGKVDFVPGTAREDLSNWTQPGGALTITDAVNQNSPVLGAIKISDNNVNGVCEKYTFSYSYFTDNTTPLPAFFSGMNMSTDKKKLKLDYLQETTCDGSLNIPPYHFEYFSEQVPRQISFGMDHWGFINGAANTDLLPSLTKNSAAYLTTTDTRETAWPAMRAGTLNIITYPTGGTTTYDYEANTFQVNNIEKNVGGLRIKTITQSNTMDVTKNMVTSFKYTDDAGHSNAILYGVPTYILKLRNDINNRTNSWLETQYGCFPTTAPIYSRNSIQPMASTQGYHIGYSEVKVSKTGNGFSKYRYYGTDPWLVDHSTLAITNFNDAGGGTYGACSLSIPNYPAAPLPNDFKRGELKYEGNYNEAGQIISEKEYYPVYQESPVVIPGYIYASFQNGAGNATLGTMYELKTARKTSNTIIERTYALTGQTPIETSTQTLFESPYHHQATKIITTNSLGQSIEKRIKYSNEFIVSTISSITNCNYQGYTNAVNAFPSNYLTQLSSCDSYSGINRTVCIGTTWYNYVKDVSTARLAYLNCRSTNYTNTTPVLNTYQTTHNTAKKNATGDLPSILWMQDIYMNSPVEVSEWKNGKLLSAAYTQYSNNRQDAYGVYPDKTLKIDLSTPSATFTATTVAANDISIIKDSRYKDLSTYDFDKGNVINVLNRDGIPMGYEWGYNQNFPIVKILNASNKFKETQVPSSVTNTFSFQIGSSSPTSGNLTHTFTQSQSGNVTVSIPTGLPPNANADATYTLTGQSMNYLCAQAYTGGTSCGSTPSSITYPNVPVGTYTLSASVHTAFPSYVFNYSLSDLYQGYVLSSAGLKEFFYEGFESSPNITGTPHTGKGFSSAGFTTSFTLPNSRVYKIQWWNFTNNQWILNELPFTTNITLPGIVDDVRIFPADAQISTYTYDPLIGMTSQWDPNNKVVYYEYDALRRLSLIRDQDRNIIKKYCYNYAGQVENCNTPVTTYSSVLKSGSFTRNNCGAGYTGGTVTYTVAAGTYISTISQADADLQAQNDVANNGQGYANTNGTCTPVPVNVTITAQNWMAVSGFTVVYTNTTTLVQTTFVLTSAAGIQTLGTLAPGTYNVTISKPGNGVKYLYSVCSSGSGSGYSFTVNNITVSSTTCNFVQLDSFF